jgi:5-methyltetrahydrofolate--homocysteine methyltransferase
MNLLARLREGQPILMDGAMGTELIRRGYTGPSWRANYDASELVEQIHADYMAAGAEIVLLNTFLCSTPEVQQECPAGASAFLPFVRSQIRCDWEGLDFSSLAPQGPPGRNFNDLDAITSLVFEGFTTAGAVLLETCSDVTAFEAVERIGERTSVPMLVSFTFRTDEATGQPRTFAGLSPETIAETAEASRIVALGVNCGLDQSPKQVAEVVRRYRSATSLPILARANAGSPRDGANTSMAPDEWADEMMQVVAAGATLVGGCCGTTPEHIAALAMQLQKA